jgi:hypothetical protein
VFAHAVTGPACAWMRKASSMSRTLALIFRWNSSASVVTRPLDQSAAITGARYF